MHARPVSTLPLSSVSPFVFFYLKQGLGKLPKLASDLTSRVTWDYKFISPHQVASDIRELREFGEWGVLFCF